MSKAYGYKNQPNIGAAIKSAIASGITSRSSIFITTKINPDECTQEAAFAAVKVDVQQLGSLQLDLVLQHFPCRSNEQNQAVWKGLMQAKEQNLTRAIGVSHYDKKALEGIIALGKGNI